MAGEWRNWAGDQRCRPAAIERPRDRDELIAAVRRAREAGRSVRAAGSGHSFSDIALGDGVLLCLDNLDRVLATDPERGLAKVEAGIVLGELNRRLDERGLAFENLGDIDRQTLAGSISTATHGTGTRFVNLSAQVASIELVGADGGLREISAESDPELFRAARVGLGALGVIYAVTVRCVPPFTLNRVDSPKPLADVLGNLDELNRSDHFEFYVFPHTETALCRESRRTDEPPSPRSPAAVYLQEVVVENWVGSLIALAGRTFPRRAPALARIASRGVGRSTKVDRSFEVFASERRIKFTEMEYSVPREHAAEVVPRVLEIAARPELGVAFPIEVRFVAADDADLSPSHDRDACYVAVHQDRRLDWETYFRAVEGVMADHGGRPHWGKRHFQTAETLAGLYPRWDEFQAARARLDPEGVFRNAYTDRVLGPVRAAAEA
ncbi:MAG TPA: D-arabinono-1,4-lactone oxidase [Solirubrobacterales bacterium]